MTAQSGTRYEELYEILLPLDMRSGVRLSPGELARESELERAERLLQDRVVRLVGWVARREA